MMLAVGIGYGAAKDVGTAKGQAKYQEDGLHLPFYFQTTIF